ncbi:MAG: OB-fold domain-containing protein [Myxococcales bacterium]|nr:OB-fold domain-containing protein [Myxococcales bacterium]
MSQSNNTGEELLRATHVMEYDYKRSLGPVLSHFFTGLRDRQAYGIKTAKGKVIVPPTEYDPETGDATGDFVAVGPGGVVKTWSWIDNPKPKNHLQEAFAWALVQLDGADTALLHAVSADSEAEMSTGMRVTIKWADETIGCIQDIACFVPEEKA